ncbi:polyamine-modulated factor 1 [Anaeramoeba flamelloides]|uniref:Polyamine-modulated factor 1 n=1 Tax=Anaeramoeba flamelloides TaxID=1746091 RepID=A0ABQ8YKW0_9EUKA|nr:polyamine-modulated factor 1 [Anaeramoeba flamelloides]
MENQNSKRFNKLGQVVEKVVSKILEPNLKNFRSNFSTIGTENSSVLGDIYKQFLMILQTSIMSEFDLIQEERQIKSKLTKLDYLLDQKAKRYQDYQEKKKQKSIQLEKQKLKILKHKQSQRLKLINHLAQLNQNNEKLKGEIKHLNQNIKQQIKDHQQGNDKVSLIKDLQISSAISEKLLNQN